MPPDALQVEGLTRRYGRLVAVNDLTFQLAGGTILGLLGPNGAGKTTTLLCLCGLLRPNAGRIVYGGRALGADRGRTIPLIPEMPEVYPLLTVWEHLTFVALSMRLPEAWRDRARDLLQRFSMWEQRDMLGATLSKGMRQKTLIAATVLAGAPVLLLDEPLVGLDPRGQRELRELILELRDAGTAVVMSTHLIESAQALCDQVVILKSGLAIAEGSVAELRDRDGGKSLEDVFLEITA